MKTIRVIQRYPIIIAALMTLIVVLVLLAGDQAFLARVVAIAIVASFVLYTVVGMIRDMMRGHFGLDILAVVAMTATLVVDEYIAAIIIMLMLSGGEALEDYAGRRAKRELTALLDRSPRVAHVLVHGNAQSDEVDDVAVDEVNIGNILLIWPSEIIPVDGILLSESGTFDESSLTGESLPVERARGDEILSGVVNGSQAIRIEVLRRGVDSQYQQIIALVRQAEGSRAPVVRMADRFAIPFTAISLALAGLAWWLSGDSVRFAEVLVLATPCPLLIAAPVAFLGGLSRAAKTGIIMKSGAVIERLAQVRSVAFDKTGTLTKGKPELVRIETAHGFDENEVLQFAASAEQYSSHVLADGIRQAAAQRKIVLLSAEKASEEATAKKASLESGHAAAYVAIDGKFAGALILADDLRTESPAVVAWLRNHGIERISMLTGDARPTAETIARQAGITDVRAELLPGGKVKLAADMEPRPVMMVGDGVNDAPVLAASDVGIAMGAKGATAAGDAADVVILVDSLKGVADSIAIGKHTRSVALTAIWCGIILSIALMVVAMSGVIPAVAGALTQEVVDLITILYALRSLAGPQTDVA
jgi:heavy metal-(Cd/Co/Hg/Pb/Zn)-translocating P-type ATPase